MCDGVSYTNALRPFQDLRTDTEHSKHPPLQDLVHQCRAHNGDRLPASWVPVLQHPGRRDRLGRRRGRLVCRPERPGERCQLGPRCRLGGVGLDKGILKRPRYDSSRNDDLDAMQCSATSEDRAFEPGQYQRDVKRCRDRSLVIKPNPLLHPEIRWSAVQTSGPPTSIRRQRARLASKGPLPSLSLAQANACKSQTGIIVYATAPFRANSP